MSPLLIKISKDFATIWTTIDPIGNVALFAGLTASLSRADRHWTALRATIYATIILVVASGNQIGSASIMHVMSRANFQPGLEMLPFVVRIMVAHHATRPWQRRCQKLARQGYGRILSD
jgi:hypothetical protein